jgi:ribosome-binding ATPase YchF (GTP1/OBG family)
MKVGLVGKPNVGKSAFFRALTLAHAESGNFPFTTIEANSGIGYIKIEDPAKSFGKSSNPKSGFVRGDKRFVPIEIIDVAGLVPGAHKGTGLGNKFLDDLRQADCLIHVIDLSGATNEKGENVELNSYEPKNDILFLEEELNFWFEGVLKKNWDKISKKLRISDIKIEDILFEIMSGLNVSWEEISLAIKDIKITRENIEKNLFELVKRIREISKPIIIAANKCDVILENYKEKLDKLKNEFSNYIIIPTFAEYEFNLKTADEKKLINYTSGDNKFTFENENELNENQKNGLNKIGEVLKQVEDFGVQKVIDKAVLELLKLKPIFPGGVSKLEDKNGNVLPDCFLMKEKATALDFAYRLHTDFGDNFIKAIDVKTKMMIGKTHILKFGDIVEIISGK